jgi:hypothetical protein
LKEDFVVSGTHLTSEPREEDFVRIATAKANLVSGRLSASESGNAYEYIGANAKSPGPAFEHLAVWKQPHRKIKMTFLRSWILRKEQLVLLSQTT